MTTLVLKQQHFDVGIKSLNDSNNLDSHIVIDNTPFPWQGAIRKIIFSLKVLFIARASITLLFQTRTELNNRVIVKQLLIMEAMGCLLVLFACGIFLYLFLKMKKGHQIITASLTKKGLTSTGTPSSTKKD